MALSFGIERVEIFWQSPEYDKTTGNFYFTPIRFDTPGVELLKKKKTARGTYLASEYSADGKKLVLMK